MPVAKPGLPTQEEDCTWRLVLIVSVRFLLHIVGGCCFVLLLAACFFKSGSLQIEIVRCDLTEQTTIA